MKTLAELAQVVRSKQAGPYRLTLDVAFDDPAVYERVKRSGVITKELIAALYEVPLDRITRLIEFDPGQAFKITMRRRVTAGDPGDTDVYGACQAAPLMDVRIPWDEPPGLPPRPPILGGSPEPPRIGGRGDPEQEAS